MASPAGDDDPSQDRHEALPGAALRRATLAELDALSALHAEAFAGTMGVALGPRYRRAFLASFLQDPDAIALVAVRSDAVVGYVLGCTPERAAGSLSVAVAALLGLLRHPTLVTRPQVRRELASRVRRLRGGGEDEVEPEDFALVAIGCAASERRRGTGAALVAGFEAEARRRGGSLLRLSVYRANEPARALYRAAGWVEEEGLGRNPEILYCARRLQPDPAQREG